MAYLFSPDFKFRTWRRLWIALAEAEKELGLPITDQQIAELKAHAQDINYEDAENLKRELPRIPFAPDFAAFAAAGKKLAELHLNPSRSSTWRPTACRSPTKSRR